LLSKSIWSLIIGTIPIILLRLLIVAPNKYRKQLNEHLITFNTFLVVFTYMFETDCHYEILIHSLNINSSPLAVFADFVAQGRSPTIIAICYSPPNERIYLKFYTIRAMIDDDWRSRIIVPFCLSHLKTNQLLKIWISKTNKLYCNAAQRLLVWSATFSTEYKWQHQIVIWDRNMLIHDLLVMY